MTNHLERALTFDDIRLDYQTPQLLPVSDADASFNLGTALLEEQPAM